MDRRPESLLESYSRPGSGLERFEVQGMGTSNVLLLGGAPLDALRRGAQEAFELLSRLEQVLSKFLPSSDVSLLNLLGASRPVAIGRDLHHLLLRCREAWELTGGAFDPTVGPLLDAWGLVRMEGKLPGDSDLTEALRCVGMQHVLFREDTGSACFARQGVSIDLGGIAKGYAVDLIAERLQSRHIPSGAVISGRSSLVVWGSPPGEERWRLEVLHPDDPEETLRVLLVEPGAISTSGPGERNIVVGGRRYGHVIDPRTGRPARGVKGVTVWTETALVGDALSTALFVLGLAALGDDGPVRRLAERWHRGEGTARASVLLLLENPSVWGGLSVVERHFGPAGFHGAEP